MDRKEFFEDYFAWEKEERKSQFEKDLTHGAKAEKIVLDFIREKTITYPFVRKVESVANDPDCYYKGDIRITLDDGEEIYVEVKNDRVIGTSHRMLCEEKVVRKQGGRTLRGDMHKDHNIMAITSMDTKTIYFVDSEVIKSIYKQGEYACLEYPDSCSVVYFVELAQIAAAGGLIEKADYSFLEK